MMEGLNFNQTKLLNTVKQTRVKHPTIPKSIQSTSQTLVAQSLGYLDLHANVIGLTTVNLSRGCLDCPKFQFFAVSETMESCELEGKGVNFLLTLHYLTA